MNILGSFLTTGALASGQIHAGGYSFVPPGDYADLRIAAKSGNCWSRAHALELIGESGKPEFLTFLDTLSSPDFSDGSYEVALCIARAKLGRPSGRSAGDQREYLLDILRADCPVVGPYYLRVWVMSELVNLGDQSVWPAITAELEALSWTSHRGEVTAKLRIKLDYSSQGTAGLLHALQDERDWVVFWAYEQLLLHKLEARLILGHLNKLVAKIEAEYQALRAHRQVNIGEFEQRWGTPYARSLAMMKNFGGEDRLAQDRFIRQLWYAGGK